MMTIWVDYPLGHYIESYHIDLVIEQIKLIMSWNEMHLVASFMKLIVVYHMP